MPIPKVQPMAENIDQYLPAWRRRREEQAAAVECRLQAARGAADRMSRILVAEYGAERVHLIGSLLRAEDFSSHSDIDLVVTGLEPRLYFKALARIWQELPPGMEVDLIPFEDAAPQLQSLVATEGVLLYDKVRAGDPAGRD